MSGADDRITRLLVEGLDAELGARLEIPMIDDDTPVRSVGRPRRRAFWVLPLAAAAVVAAITGGTVALVDAASSGDSSTPPSVPGTKGVQVTCAASGGADAGADRTALLARAKKIAHGDATATATVTGSTISVTVPGATRADVAGLCTSSSLALRPLIAPPVPYHAGTSADPLRRLGFDVPASEAAYDRLTTQQRTALATALGTASCAPAADSAKGPMVACDDGRTAGSKLVALLGAPLVAGSDVAGARAQAPNVAGGSGSVEWTVAVTFDHAAARTWSTYTSRHHTSPTASSASVLDCSAGIPCRDYVGFVTSGRLLSLPLTVATIPSGTTTQISGNFTEASAKSLAAALRSGPLPVPLTPVSVTPTG